MALEHLQGFNDGGSNLLRGVLPSRSFMIRSAAELRGVRPSAAAANPTSSCITALVTERRRMAMRVRLGTLEDEGVSDRFPHEFSKKLKSSVDRSIAKRNRVKF